MVLEGVVVSVLNRFLGPYIKNLDSSQLKVAIWSGKSKRHEGWELFLISLVAQCYMWYLCKCTYLLSGEVKLEGLQFKETALVSLNTLLSHLCFYEQLTDSI